MDRHAHISREMAETTTDKKLEEETAKLLPRDYRKRKGYSVNLVHQPYAGDLESLYARAGKTKLGFDEVIREIAQATGGSPAIPALKGEQRARMKAQFKYCDQSGGIAWYRLSDIVRATIAYQDIDAMYKGLLVVRERFQPQNVLEFNDRFQVGGL